MNQSIFQMVKGTASRLGGCDPLWLKNEQPPVFEYTEHGTTGPDIMLLHGLFGALSNWETVIPLMAQYSKPIALKFPILTGHRSEVKVKALSAYTEYFARERGIQPVTLCGNSLGGHVALRLCLASPEVIDCLILSATSGLYERTVDALPVRPGEKFVRDHLVRVFYNKDFVTETAIMEVANILKVRKNTLNLIHAARSAKKDNLSKVLENIKVPTLILWGEDDEVTPMEVAEQFNRSIPNSKLVSIKKCGHAPMIEHPEWFASETEKFLREHSRHFKAVK